MTYVPLVFAFLFLFSSLLGKDFVLFTEPKTGTHLLIPILETLTGKKVYWAKEFAEQTPKREFLDHSDFENPQSFLFSMKKIPWDRNTMEQVWQTTKSQGAFLHLHPPYSSTMENFLAEKKCVNFFVKRDPRDRIVSLLNHYKNIRLEDSALENISSDDERLLFIIKNNLREEIIHFSRWQNSSLCCVLDFHKLMGSHGGAATDQEALGELKKITQALSIEISDRRLLEIYKQHFGKGWNFFRGKVGTWRETFNEEHKSVIKKEVGDLLVELGYENDDQW